MSNAYPDGVTAVQVHCDTCGATPGDPCTTPRGALAAAPHQDRRANAFVVERHLRYLDAR